MVWPPILFLVNVSNEFELYINEDARDSLPTSVKKNIVFEGN